MYIIRSGERALATADSLSDDPNEWVYFMTEESAQLQLDYIKENWDYYLAFAHGTTKESLIVKQV